MKNAKRKVEVFGKEKLKMVKEIHTLILFAFHGYNKCYLTWLYLI